MRPRVRLARALVRLGGFVQSLALPVMRPRDIIEMNRLHYSDPETISFLASERFVDGGLEPGEAALLEYVPLRQGRFLNLLGGGGREAIAFARMGFDVTSVDFLPELTEGTLANAARQGLRIEALTQDVTRLDLPAGSFDVAWLAAQMYSSIPGRAGRIRMLRGVAEALKPGGFFITQFRWQASSGRSRAAEAARKVMAVVSAGYIRYQAGDHLMGNSEFIHAFSSQDELRSEFARGGFDVLHLRFDDERLCGWAALKKSPPR